MHSRRFFSRLIRFYKCALAAHRSDIQSLLVIFTAIAVRESITVDDAIGVPGLRVLRTQQKMGTELLRSYLN